MAGKKKKSILKALSHSNTLLFPVLVVRKKSRKKIANN